MSPRSRPRSKATPGSPLSTGWRGAKSRARTMRPRGRRPATASSCWIGSGAPDGRGALSAFSGARPEVEREGKQERPGPEREQQGIGAVGRGEQEGEAVGGARLTEGKGGGGDAPGRRSEEHTSELQSRMRISYAIFC